MKILWLAAVLLFVSAPTLASAGDSWMPLREPIPDTPVIDQNGHPLHFYSDLVKGRTVAIDFIFTSCSTICQPLTANFRKLQKSTAAGTLHLISISVDPDVDRPKVLRDFAAGFGAEPGWTFVTGKRSDIGALLKALDAFTGDKTSHTSMV